MNDVEIRDIAMKAANQAVNGLDPGVERVREFHSAFGCVITPAPWMPELSVADQQVMLDYARALSLQAEALKAHAALANGAGRAGLGLVLIRLQLHLEEACAEYALACATGDLVAILDSLSDSSYVVDGTYLTHGLAGVKVAADVEVHRSNMSKLDEAGRPMMSPAGRVIKGPNWSPPDLDGVLNGLIPNQQETA